VNKSIKVILCAVLGSVLFGAGLLVADHHNSKIEKPTSLIHVVTLDWKADATPEQIKAALDGVANMEYPGLKRVWLRSIKSQTKQAAFAMEFESEKALEDYAGSPAQEAWYKLYLPIRERSVTSDITN
jgi:hypothetical protein